MTKRFTIDGAAELEQRLHDLCQRVCVVVRGIWARRELAAIVLGGGYGRGEGGVWKSNGVERPYNDLEFYILGRGNRHWHEYRHGKALERAAEELSIEAGLHVEFKVESAARLSRSAVTMFSYDLVSGHRVVFGDESIFQRCGHHLDASAIPLSEATRLLWNRCSGLLLAGEMLNERGAGAGDFIGRNLAKANLALGDAVLVVFGQYHWSARERHRRLNALDAGQAPDWLPEIQDRHAAGMEFKLHPGPARKSPEEFLGELRETSSLAQQLWLWLENRRLNRCFKSSREYALSGVAKCPGAPVWRNLLLTLKTFGPRGALSSAACRYPRERLFNALPLLLWDAGEPHEPQIIRRLRRDLRTAASDRSAFLAAYKQLWPKYG